MAINIDVPPVADEETALCLMFHHLQLAAAYFEATPATFEIPEHFSASAMRAWAGVMERLYPEMEAA